MDNFASSVLDLDRVLELQPGNARAVSVMGKVLVQQGEQLEEKGDCGGAKEAFLKALSFDPNLVGAKTGLERLKGRRKQGRPTDALIDLTADEDGGRGERAQSEKRKLKDDLLDDPVSRKRRLAELEEFKRSLMQKKP